MIFYNFSTFITITIIFNHKKKNIYIYIMEYSNINMIKLLIRNGNENLQRMR